MNRALFYAKRRVYRLMKRQDNDDYSSYPSQEQGKFWSGMERFDPPPYWRKGTGRWRVGGEPGTMQMFYSVMKDRYIQHSWDLSTLRGIISRALKEY